MSVPEGDLCGHVGEENDGTFIDPEMTRVDPLPVADLDDAWRQGCETALSGLTRCPPGDRTCRRVPPHKVSIAIEHGEAVAHRVDELRLEWQGFDGNSSHPESIPLNAPSDDRCVRGSLVLVQYPRGESNACLRLRRPPLYPLSYGGGQASILGWRNC